MQPLESESASQGTGIPGALRVAAVASLAAGAIHAACIGAHADEKKLAVVFAITAALQIAWGAVALVRSGRGVVLAGVLVNGGAVVGWAWAKTVGVSFIPGLENPEPAGFADTACAALAAIAVVAALISLSRRTTWAGRPHPALVGVAGIAALSLAVPGMVSAGEHDHGGHGNGHDSHDSSTAMGDMPGMDHGHGGAPAPAVPYTGKLPVNLGGVPGVTAKEQANAEALVTRTIKILPAKFADFDKTQTEGWNSIHDAFAPGQYEHLVNWPLIDDKVQLDPNQPESLVYQIQPDMSRKLVAAMYMFPRSVNLDNFPDIGGPLVQAHIHDNLCYRGQENAWTVAGVADPPAPCPQGTFRFAHPEPMIHVWIVGNECGPFAALEGIGGGQIAAGQTRACDTAHGASSS